MLLFVTYAFAGPCQSSGVLGCAEHAATSHVVDGETVSWQDLGLVEFDAVSGGMTVYTYSVLGSHLASRQPMHACSNGFTMEGVTRLSDDGHLWVANDLNCGRLDDSLQRYAENHGTTHIVTQYDFTQPDVYQPEDLGIPLAWTGGACGKDSQVTWALWDDESRVAQPTGSTLQPRLRSSVFVAHTGLPGSEISDGCSGVLVGDEWVLTAAHCVTDDDGNRFSTSNLRVRLGNHKYGSTEVKTPTAVYLDVDPWNEATRTDYALLELPSPFSSGSPSVMEIGNWSDSHIETQFANTFGYPFAIDPPTTSCAQQSEMFAEFGASVLSASTHLPTGRGIVQTNLDATSRQSGSPIYACEDTPCVAPLSGTIIAVLTDIHPSILSPTAVRGPKTSGRLHDWAVGIMAP